MQRLTVPKRLLAIAGAMGALLSSTFAALEAAGGSSLPGQPVKIHNIDPALLDRARLLLTTPYEPGRISREQADAIIRQRYGPDIIIKEAVLADYRVAPQTPPYLIWAYFLDQPGGMYMVSSAGPAPIPTP